MLAFAILILGVTALFAWAMYRLVQRGPSTAEPLPDDIYFEEDEEDEDWENMFEPYNLREPSGINSFYDYDVDPD